jgi:hypothetical protein
MTTLLIALAASTGLGSELAPIVEVEEVVTSYVPADNGASPLWCYGSTTIARRGDDVFLSLIETGKDVPPLCNTRWQLWHRSGETWKLAQSEKEYRQREPCPIAVFHSGPVFLSINPSTRPPGTKYGPCQPQVLQFDAADLSASPKVHAPEWQGRPSFTDHSYRGFAADGRRGELLLLNIDAQTGLQHVSFCNRQGKWHAKRAIEFPIRSCYPQIALCNGTAHVMAIGDIVEPNEAWRKLKLEKLQRQWDYVFRRLFYAFTQDIQDQPFSEPIEIDAVEKTCGHISNLDLHIDTRGVAHLLYLKRPHQYAFIRDAYFPGQPMTVHLEYVLLKNGGVISRRTLAETTAERREMEPVYGRFHVGRTGELHVVMAGSAGGDWGNFVGRIPEQGQSVQWVRLDLRYPFRTFFTNTPRGGSKPGDVIDLFGIADDPLKLRYAAVRLRK